ncbi:MULTISPECIES: hypothetical protein [unclassified Kaistella]|uniref:hypothetical protein n=1 Tax=unclassified Kaistella TaxID=2762626 RepID=UPI002732B67C|nr:MULTISPECIES: hypothetical protein [unclassified Kaistella]MDP2455234.1 hypothetical protein [Kaistella sp. SH11-4b]MDP2458081.1 hypothetical protein [Kaistella sp. SH40-3]MDP2461048.1 hypothetical protein [Kaistella sp. SH19-2b]
MTKFLIILLALYILYYIGNMVYDLFVKKESTLVTEEIDVFSLVEFEEQNRDAVTTVGIEDVENLNTPKSFNKKEFPIDTEISEEREDIEVWRRRFESEQNIDSFDLDAVESEVVHNVIDDVTPIENNEPELMDQVSTEDPNQILRKINKKQWYQMLNDAESTVQMISNTNGHKVYQAAGF